MDGADGEEGSGTEAKQEGTETNEVYQCGHHGRKRVSTVGTVVHHRPLLRSLLNQVWKPKVIGISR